MKYSTIRLPLWSITNDQPKKLTTANAEIILATNLRIDCALNLNGCTESSALFIDIFGVITDCINSNCYFNASPRAKRRIITIMDNFIINNRMWLSVKIDDVKPVLLQYLEKYPSTVHIYYSNSDIKYFIRLCDQLIESGDFSDNTSLKVILNKLNCWYSDDEFTLTDSVWYKSLTKKYPHVDFNRIMNRYKLTGKF